MSKKTHRWKSRHAMKLQNVPFNNEIRFHSEQCLVSLNFERSDYFRGSNLPRTFIFNDFDPYKKPQRVKTQKDQSELKETKSLSYGGTTNERRSIDNLKSLKDSQTQCCMSPVIEMPNLAPLNPNKDTRISKISEPKEQVMTTDFKAIDRGSLKRWSIEINSGKNPLKPLQPSTMSSIMAKNTDEDSFEKLYVTEYIELVSVEAIPKVKNNKIKCYIFNRDHKNSNEILILLEDLKNSLPTGTWGSFQMIVVSDGFNISNEILQRQEITPTEKENVEEKEVENDDDMDDMDDSDYEPSNFDSSEFADLVGGGKYRDSKFIKLNQTIHKLSSDDHIDEQSVMRSLRKMAKALDSNIGVALKTSKELRIELDNLVEILDSNDDL